MGAKRALWDARAKWGDIGRCIGVDEGTLDTMKGKDGDCLSGVLSHWLGGVYNPKDKNSRPRTWRTLIEALRDKVVNEEAMADKLEKEKYPDTNQGNYITIIILLLLMFYDRKGPFHTRCGNLFVSNYLCDAAYLLKTMFHRVLYGVFKLFVVWLSIKTLRLIVLVSFTGHCHLPRSLASLQWTKETAMTSE